MIFLPLLLLKLLNFNCARHDISANFCDISQTLGASHFANHVVFNSLMSRRKKFLAKFFANEAERLTVQCTSALIAWGCIKEQLWKLDPGKTLLTESERKNSFISIFSLNRNFFLAQILHLSTRLLFPCSERFLSFQLWKNLWSVECFLSARFMRSLLRLYNFKLLLFH